jgi:hypothetical protein
MTVSSIRKALAAVLALLAVVAVVFYERQNTGEYTGGAISLPKMLWLSYALAAWFVVPFFLWRDERLAAAVRRMFGVFWMLMILRGVYELPLLYIVKHWHPAYGISHDLLCMAAILCARQSLPPLDVVNRRAVGYSTSLIVGLAAEVAFAGMFLQTGAHQQGVYFASAAAQWGYINLATMAALAFVCPDFLAAMVGLYFPGIDRETPRPLRRCRGAIAALAVGVLAAALGFYTYMMRVESKGARFQQVGFEIADSCMQFKEAFLKGDEQAMADFIESGDGSWQLKDVEHPFPVELKRWESGGPTQSLRQFTIAWRKRLPEVLQAAFKIHLVDDVRSDTEADVQLRFEVTSASNTTDTGLIRCRFGKGALDRWRIRESSLIEGTTVAGPGNYFVDVARRRGIDFVLEPDERLLPGACDHCKDAISLKFQTMRHAYAGCATADVDGDGWDDVLFCSGGKLALYRNKGDGTFDNITDRAGLGHLQHANVACFADLDNDGDTDLFCAAFYENCYLFKNSGDGTFTDVTSRSGIKQSGMVTCCCVFDYNRDGKLDLYLGRFLDSRKAIPDSFLYSRNGEPNILYRNDGAFHFTDVSEQAGVGDVGLTLSLNAADYDGDGWQDLFVANDFGRSVLYKNLGNGTFRDVSKETGCLAIGGDMSATWGDFMNEGRLGLYTGAIRSNQRWFIQPITARRVLYKYVREGRLLTTHPLFEDLKAHLGDDWVNIGNWALAGNYLFRQNADGTFTNIAEEAGARPAGWYWSCGFFDIDNDGWLDIYASNGWISGKDPHDL